VSNFVFLRAEWPELHEEAVRAERIAIADPRASCFYARRTLELTLDWLYEADETLRLPFRSDLAAKIAEPTMVKLVGAAVRTKMDIIRREGNAAVHKSGPVSAGDSVRVMGELFHVMYWLARHYVRDITNQPSASLAFDQSVIPRPLPAEVRKKKQAEIQAMAEQFARQQAELTEALRKNRDLGAAIAELQAEIKTAKAANIAVPDTHDYDEAATRQLIIDLLLKEAGWPLDRKEDREFPVTGMPTPSGKGTVDYVLWDDDGRPLGLVEAKRTTMNALAGQQQARLYADQLEARSGQRPIIFCTNGYQTHIWDDLRYPPRVVQGFYSKEELRLLIQRRISRHATDGLPINDEIVSRYYQIRAIRRIAKTFELDNRRAALLVMATGGGKTRTTIGLVDLLIRTNWVKRVLFLADRQALVTQATNAFKQHLPGVPTVNLLTEKDTEARVYVSTYPTMMGLINEITDDGRRRFGPGYFDLVVIDEAHRSVYQKYRAIFEYFDSLLVGLTATPKDEVDRNTYRLFDLPAGEPTDSYSLDEAVEDGWLVPPGAVDVPLKFPRRGIKYDELSEEDKEAWDAAEWEDEQGIPTEVTPDEINKFLFNGDTIDKTLETVMTLGLTVEAGDRLGKTIIFARNNNHAEFIAERFNKIYPEHRGEFAQVITYQKSYAQSLIDAFKMRDKPPHIAISVDMLDTGIDVPEVVNLVFAKPVHSKTKFWQMIGRGTRLCPDLFGPNLDKEGFLVFDLCQNVEFFNQNLPTVEGHLQLSLSEQIFRRRADLLLGLDQLSTPEPATGTTDGAQSEAELRRDVAQRLQEQVVGMDPTNIEVRRHLREVETYRELSNWQVITPEKHAEINDHLAGLPTAFREDEYGEEAKRFDYLVLRLQLAYLHADPGYMSFRSQVQEIASALLDEITLSIPAVRDQRVLLEDVASDEWWPDITLPMLETMRRRLRGLVKLLPRIRRGVIYTDFEDELGELSLPEIKGLPPGVSRSRFETKVRSYLRSHDDEPAVRKLRGNEQLTVDVLYALQDIFIASGYGTTEDIEAVAEEHGGFGLFLRSITGLDHEAATAAFEGLVSGRILSPPQLAYMNLLTDSLARNGLLDVGNLYESPFTARAPHGPEDLFSGADVDSMADVLAAVRATAQPTGHSAAPVAE